MRVVYTRKFVRQFDAAPRAVQEPTRKQIAYLLQNLRHPSLRAKKYDEQRGIWQARATGSWRFYFRIEGDAYLLLNIRSHPK
jgi:hypothetical protein